MVSAFVKKSFSFCKKDFKPFYVILSNNLSFGIRQTDHVLKFIAVSQRHFLYKVNKLGQPKQTKKKQIKDIQGSRPSLTLLFFNRSTTT